MMHGAGPADDWRAGDAEISLIKKPPAICQAKGECQEVRLCRELIGYQQTSLAQQSLALLQGRAHLARGMQHVCRKADVIFPNGVALHAIQDVV